MLYFEIKRKIFHLAAILLALIYYFLPFEQFIYLIASLTGLVVIIDLLRMHNKFIARYFYIVFGSLMRNFELKNKLTGASYMFLSFLITCILFEKNIAISSWLILIIADSIAALIGRKYGKIKIKFTDKSYAGSCVFFISSLIIISIYQIIILDQNITIAHLFAIFAASLAELVAKNIKIDDNLLIPVSYCITLTLLN